MFPTFISILDIQSWWEVPSIAHFCSLFRTAFNLLDFDIEDLEEALLTDGTEETSWLQELIVRLLSGCLPNNEISTFNYQMFLRRLFRQKCQEHDRYNPFNTDVDFQLLPLRTKVDILTALCDFRLDAEDVLEQLKNLEADSLRVEPLGYDSNDSAYWYFYGTRLYREDFNVKNNKKKSVWQVICFTEDDWFQLDKKFKKSTVKCERQLHRTLTENFLPELPRLFREKERLARKRLLDNQPRRTSQRLRKENGPSDKEELIAAQPPSKVPNLEDEEEEEEKQRKRDLEVKRREAYERRNRLKEHSEDSQSEKSAEGRYEMGGAKNRQKKSKGRQRKLSASSNASKDGAKSGKRKKSGENASSTSTSTSASTTTVGRQTNNSLAAATGQIVIQPVSNPHKKKLKTSQVFRQTDEDLLTGMHKILDHVKNHENAWPFADPVDEDYAPNYYTVIRKPMDLQRMEDRLDAGYYKNFTKFRDDFQLIVDNCRLYNGAENEYTEMVDDLVKVFERATEKFLDQISSSDDEIAVEFPDADVDGRDLKRSKSSSKRKPSLAAKTDKKRDRSLSEDSIGKRSEVSVILEKIDKIPKKDEKIKKNSNKKEKIEIKKSIKDKKPVKVAPKHRKEKNLSPVRTKSKSRSRSISRSPLRRGYSSSPPPSSVPSSPDTRFDFFPKKHSKTLEPKESSASPASKEKSRQKHDKFKNLFENKTVDSKKPPAEKSSVIPKPKDKHNKLRETIEKLKAKSEISHKLTDSEFCFDLMDNPKENKSNKHSKYPKKDPKSRLKRDQEHEDSNSTLESALSDKKAKKVNTKPKVESEQTLKDINKWLDDSPPTTNKLNSKKKTNAKSAAIEALTIATEQTLKDINKWLDDTPKFGEFSSASNSPSYGALEEFEKNTDSNDSRKKLEKPGKKDECVRKDVKRRTFTRDPSKFLKRREIQRTIDRLQPGKGKGNLLTNVPNLKQDEVFPLGSLSKAKDAKNSLIVKTDDNAPKLSLGTVLDSFGRHKFVDDKKSEDLVEDPIKDEQKTEEKKETDNKIDSSTVASEKSEPKKEETASSGMMSGATPNLSAWFKAFGAPKVQSGKKGEKTEGKDAEKADDGQKAKEETVQKVVPPDISPRTDSPLPHGQPIPRQRKVSTGSSISERSSFSQDMDSPRVGIDERLGAYPAPYPSPLHRSPSGASPIMVSPRPDVSPKAPYPPFNGQMRVGFYQDTVSNKSSPDKSCSPRDNPQSPYMQPSEHVYTPNTTQSATYSYPNSPYYTQPNYSNPNPNPTPPYNSESYYDTNKSLTDQYQAKVGYVAPSSPRTIQHNPHSPVPVAIDSTYRDEHKEKIQNNVFPVKKRAYNNESESINRYDMDMNRLQPVENVADNNKPMVSPVPVQHPQQPSPQQQQQQQQQQDMMRGLNYPPYGNAYGGDSNYPLNIPTRPLPQSDLERKMDMSKYTNMGYTGPEVGFPRLQYNYPRGGSNQGNQANQAAPGDALRYPNPNHLQMAQGQPPPPPAHPHHPPSQMNYGGAAGNSIPRPNYNAHLEMEQQALGLRGNIANLSHIVDRYGNDERILTGLQTPPAGSQYYGDKGLGPPPGAHMFNKPPVSSSSGLAVFSQSAMQTYNQSMQATSSMYNRQMTELQSPMMANNEPPKVATVAPPTEKKTKKRKSKNAPAASAAEPPASTNQGFQSYAGLKGTAEPSAISLKTASVVPGSAFNFGPTPTGLGIGSGLYGDKDAYANFLEDFRAAPNYYMAHHRSTPETAGDKQTRAAHQSSAPQPPSYPFIGTPQARPPSYSLGSPFMPSAQGPLMDTTSPLYQHYLQAGVLNQGLLGPPGAYPPGYHPALSMRQPYESMTRPPWL